MPKEMREEYFLVGLSAPRSEYPEGTVFTFESKTIVDSPYFGVTIERYDDVAQASNEKGS
jgi:hypothetical protein